MRAPHLNRRLVLEEAVRVPDGAGGFAETWVALGVLWGEIRSGTGRERAQDFVTTSSVPMKVTLRAAPEGAPSRPKPEQRFREGGRVFRIQSVAEANGSPFYLTCTLREEVAA